MSRKLGAAVLLVSTLLLFGGQQHSFAQSPESSREMYVVQPGDTLGRVAHRYEVSIDSIASVNNIANPDLIFVDQVLVIPTRFFLLSPEQEQTRSEDQGCKRVAARVTAYNSTPQQGWGDPFMTASGYALKTPIGSLVAEAVIAAPPEYPFGTRILVPGYGWGIVRDRGGKVVGNHFDVWMHSYQDALRWGVVHTNVTVC